jgi:hypothetical protein
MSDTIDVRQMAKASPTRYSANLVVRVSYPLPEQGRENDTRAPLHEVWEMEALERIGKHGWTPEKIALYRTRCETYSLEWKNSDKRWLGDETLLEVMTQANYGHGDDYLSALISAGSAEFAPVRPYRASQAFRDFAMRTSIISRIAARAFILEEGGHKIDICVHPRIDIQPKKIRTTATHYDSKIFQHVYQTGEPSLHIVTCVEQAIPLLKADTI